MSWSQVFCVLKMNKVFVTIIGHLSDSQKGWVVNSRAMNINFVITH